jgi:hypothetical protein
MSYQERLALYREIEHLRGHPHNADKVKEEEA